MFFTFGTVFNKLPEILNVFYKIGFVLELISVFRARYGELGLSYGAVLVNCMKCLTGWDINPR